MTAAAEHAFAELNDIMAQLAETVSQETAHARAGRLRAAAELGERKLDLARRYAAQSQHLKAGLAGTLPAVLDELRNKHTAFQSLLQTNMMVLATAHAVAEGIIRGVSGELARKQAPSTYGRTGRANPPAAKTSQPLALSRTL